MNKKILIGSIIAVAILVGVSFTSVVGYRSVDSDVKASPLFNIRSSRAIDEDSNNLSCEFVGKGEPALIIFPKQNEYDILFKKIMEYINKENNEKKKIKDIFLILNHLKGNIDDTNKYIFEKNSIFREDLDTANFLCWWEPGILLNWVFAVVLLIIMSIFHLTFTPSCTYPCLLNI